MDFTYINEPYIKFINDTIPIIHFPGYYNNLMIIIPLVIDVCVSLPALMWMLYFFYTLQKHGGRILSFVLLLIINNLFELLLSVIITSFVIDNLEKYRAISLKQIIKERYMLFMLFERRKSRLFSLLITFRIGGIYLHQLVALQGILSLKSQRCSVDVFSPLCSTISCIILWLIAFGCQFLYTVLLMAFSFLSCCILVLTCMITCKSSPSPDHIRPGSAVLIISTLTLISFCATAGVVFVLGYLSRNHYIIHSLALPVFLVRLRVISDPLLCVLVCNEELKIHKRKMHTELISEYRSV